MGAVSPDPFSSLAVTYSRGTHGCLNLFSPQIEFFLGRMQSHMPNQSLFHHTLSSNASVNKDQFSGRSTTHFKSVFIQKTCVRETTLNTACNQIFFFLFSCVLYALFKEYIHQLFFTNIDHSGKCDPKILLGAVICLNSSVKE